MPLLKQSWAFIVARNVRLFLNLEAGITRGGRPGSADERPHKVDKVDRQLVAKDREDARLRAKLATSGAPSNEIRPEKIIWIFGVARTGSSWLGAMMGDLEGHAMWYEPYVGDVFGYAYYTRAADWQRERGEFILGNQYKEVWIGSVRTFVLEGANARFPEMPEGGYLVIKEPNGSVGAPLLVEAMPESRVVLLVRDSRDVVASLLAAQKKGSWGSGDSTSDGGSLADRDQDEFVRQRAKMYMASVGKAKDAYEAHRGYKAVVRYEDLRYDTLGELKRIYSVLEIPADERELEQIVEKHAWENIPEERKGADKPRRKATPGAWREDLTTAQARIVGEITAPMLDEFYPGWDSVG